METPRIWLSQGAVDLMVDEASRTFPLETGGLLLGYRSTDDQVVVTEVTLPGPLAKHARSSFTPDQKHDVDRVALRYRESAGQTTYLGDWHSHASSPPYLSARDEKVLRRIGRWDRAQVSNPVMVIVGSLPDAALVAWEWTGCERRWWGVRDFVRQVELRSH